MRDDLMPEQVEVYPGIGAAPLRATERAAVKGACRGEIVDGKGEIERYEFFGLPLRQASNVTPHLVRGPLYRIRIERGACCTVDAGTNPA